jgi:hypothetical protein
MRSPVASGGPRCGTRGAGGPSAGVLCTDLTATVWRVDHQTSGKNEHQASASAAIGPRRAPAAVEGKQHSRSRYRVPCNRAARLDAADGPARCYFRWKRPSPASPHGRSLGTTRMCVAGPYPDARFRPGEPVASTPFGCNGRASSKAGVSRSTTQTLAPRRKQASSHEPPARAGRPQRASAARLTKRWQRGAAPAAAAPLGVRLMKTPARSADVATRDE